MRLKILPFVCFLLMSRLASAYIIMAESGELVEPGKSTLGFFPQFILSDGGAFNFVSFVDTGLTESTSMRLQLSAGDTDIAGGASFKWVPIPDYQNQPAIGLKLGAFLGREGDSNFSHFQVAPLLSKKQSTDYGLFIPYGAIQWSNLYISGENLRSLQLVAGTEYVHDDTNLKFGAELALEAKDASTYLGVWITVPFEDLGSLSRSNSN